VRNATAPPKTKNGKPKKRVTIISPPQSPVDVPERPRRLSDGKTGSPPPPPVTVTPEDVTATNATSTADPNLQRAFWNTQRNSDGAEPLPQPGSTGIMRAPYNPFARTLATSDAHLGLHRATTEERGSEKPTGPPKMNVDMFKNLLMTGSASPSPPVTQHTQPQRPLDSSSSTDTSSVSRQSLFDPAHELHPESPRTSFDQQSISDDDEEDSEHVSLMGPTTSRPEAEGPPPPPKHRHGKALGPKGPQTVSFADFNESIPAGWQQPSGPRTPPVNSHLQGILRPSTPRSPSSDLNKPLPPPPEAQAAPEALSQTMADDKPTSLPPVPQPEVPQPKKIPPPPPPTSRRQGQGQSRSRSGSNLTQNSIQEEDETPRSTTKAVPPPPPSRRAQYPPAQPSPIVETPPSTEPSSPMSENKPMPPPPRRNPSKSGSSHVRSSSNASSHSIPRLEGGAPPPAPPPRRGAAPARSSMGEHGYRRSSVQSVGSETCSLRQIDEGTHNDAAPPPKQPERDIMADLAALQAEVDALRAGAGSG
jgi:hypothetical protein